MKSPDTNSPVLDSVLAGYLYLVALACSFAAAVYLGVGPDAVRRSMPGLTNAMFTILVGAWLLGVVCALALRRRKMWGFWGFLASNLAAFAVNVSLRGFTVPTVWLGPLAVVLLWLLLRAGGEGSAWRRLQ